MRHPPATRHLFHRGPRRCRLWFFALLSLVLLFVDARYRYLENVRRAARCRPIPLQRLGDPGEALAMSATYFSPQRTLARRQRALQAQPAELAPLAQATGGREENAQLRGLLTRGRIAVDATAAEILYAERDPFTRKILIDNGARPACRPGRR